jgi:uncharacterized protein YqgC (DUF456 family)
MAVTELLVGLAILVGLVGIVVPVLPGSILILGAVLVWALEVSTGTGWAVFAVATTLLVIGCTSPSSSASAEAGPGRPRDRPFEPSGCP